MNATNSVTWVEKLKELTIQKAIQMVSDYLDQEGISVDELSERTGIPPRTIYSILSGERKDPRFSTLKKLLRGCGIGVYGIRD